MPDPEQLSFMEHLLLVHFHLIIIELLLYAEYSRLQLRDSGGRMAVPLKNVTA